MNKKLYGARSYYCTFLKITFVNSVCTDPVWGMCFTGKGIPGYKMVFEALVWFLFEVLMYRN